MIVLDKVSKSYPTRHGRKLVLDKVDLTIKPGEKIGILGYNGAGKSTLIKLISGSEPPSSGTVTRKMSISWPIASGGAFQGGLTGLDNVKFICRIYDVDYREKLPYIEEFSELGKFLREPVKIYSRGMKGRLAFAVSLALDFDCYLVDESMSAGDVRFRERCREALMSQTRERAMVMVSHTDKFIEDFCDRAAILRKGKLTLFDDVYEAVDEYEARAA